MVKPASLDEELSQHAAVFADHPFVDAMLQYIGSYDFGGLIAARSIASPKLRGKSGYLFAFVVRQRITRDDGDECLFRFEPVFVNSKGEIDFHSCCEGPADCPRVCRVKGRAVVRR